MKPTKHKPPAIPKRFTRTTKLHWWGQDYRVKPRAVLIEREPAYCAIARQRCSEAMGTGLLAGIV